MQPTVAFNLATFEVYVEFHDAFNHEKLESETPFGRNNSVSSNDKDNLLPSSPNILTSRKSEHLHSSSALLNTPMEYTESNENEEELYQERQGNFSGGSFLLVLSNELSSVSFKFSYIDCKEKANGVIQVIKVRFVHSSKNNLSCQSIHVLYFRDDILQWSLFQILQLVLGTTRIWQTTLQPYNLRE